MTDNETTIEPLIAPLVTAINRLDNCRTLYSCEGHLNIGLRPYVTFLAPNEIARKLSNDIDEGIMSATLQGNWFVSGNWPNRDTDALQWTLELSDIRVRKAAIPGAFLRRIKLRRLIDADCKTFVNLFSGYSHL